MTTTYTETDKDMRTLSFELHKVLKTKPNMKNKVKSTIIHCINNVHANIRRVNRHKPEKDALQPERPVDRVAMY